MVDGTGSIMGTFPGLKSGFTTRLMTGVGTPDGLLTAASGTIYIDYTADAMYKNESSDGGGLGSDWVTIGSIA